MYGCMLKELCVLILCVCETYMMLDVHTSMRHTAFSIALLVTSN